MDYLLVFLGGGLGALGRFGAEALISHSGSFPYQTFVVNILGCFLAGVALGIHLPAGSANYRFFVTGILGGFTTFSAFGYQTIRLGQQKDFAVLASYIGFTIFGCLLATWLGANIGKHFFERF